MGSRVVVRTEDGCEMEFDADRKIKTAPRWAPKHVAQKLARDLDLGDYVESYRGWSSIVEFISKA